jgi:DNA polymerase
MTKFLYIDLETYSAEPIKNGTYKYAANAEIMLVSWAIDDVPVEIIDATAGGLWLDERLLSALEDPKVVVVAHEAMFDRTVLRLQTNFCPPIERWWCTAAQARAHSLPGGLEKLCSILGVPKASSKMQGGKDLIRLFCVPQTRKGEDAYRATADSHPEEWEEFKQYSVMDTEAMREVHKRLPRWNYGGEHYRGRNLWHLDQRVNDRGFCVDVQMAEQAVAAVERVKDAANARTSELTDDAVGKATQRDAMLKHLLNEFGVDLPDMQSATLERRLQDDNLPEDVRELIAIRLQVSTASVAKYKALMRSVTEDGRLHGTLLYCGAQRTGRRSGRLFQPQNLARVPKHIIPHYDDIADIMRAGGADLLLPNPIETMGYMARGAIQAAPGKKLNVADLSNIEGRMMAWAAQEDWKLKAFREFDAGVGHDLYVLSYAASFMEDPADVARDAAEGGIKRQVGKVQELSCQYWGGFRAFQKMSRIYGVSISDERATEVVKAWRLANKKTMDWSGRLETAARKAIRAEGAVFDVWPVKFRRTRNWLIMILPSGRGLFYPKPEIDSDGTISYMGLNTYTRKWERISTYGGKFGENGVQAMSADYMMENEEGIEAAGYGMVLDVHDEVVTETEDTEEFSGVHLAKLLATPRPWSAGLPVVAVGYSTKRYRKG